MTDPVESPTLIFCDWAEVLGGKVYIQGGGINQVLSDRPVMLALAAMWRVPWHATNTRQPVKFRLVTQDGQAVQNTDGETIEVDGEAEAGRPAGAKHGDSFQMVIAFRLQPFTLPANDYRWELEINGALKATVPFRAVNRLGLP